MRRIKITLQYNGTQYGGWQVQNNAPSIQQELETALFKLTAQHTRITGSGRTDSGVHARCQVAHFDTQSSIPPEKFTLAMNSWLPPDIRVLSSEEAPPDFHAQYNAKGKWYRYRIHNGKTASAFQHPFELHIHAPLQYTPMQNAAQLCQGEHDFASFQATGRPVKSTVRTLYCCLTARQGDRMDIHAVGNGFLYNMVRILAGTLIEVGKGALPPERMTDILAACDRGAAGPTAPAHGLTLMQVAYSDEALSGLVEQVMGIKEA